jgi:uncharacterized protein YecE (DUF72 family)
MASQLPHRLCMTDKIHIGTSGWSYKHWRNDFYPQKLRQADWFSYYANHFQTVEINNSFYKLPTEKAVANWDEIAPDNFCFCPKMSRFLTQFKKLHDPEEPLERFFGVFEPLKHKLGPVLIQLPPQLPFNYDIAEHFFHLLKTLYRNYTFVLEVRHNSWLETDPILLMTKYDIGLVISQSNGKFPYEEMITANTIYLRFHGPEALYASSYSDEMLKEYVQKFGRWLNDGHTIWAFFNNDIHGYAAKDAQRLIAMCNDL